MTSLGFEHYYGSDARASWVRRQPSVVSGKAMCVNAHVGQSGGTAIKAHHTTIVPMTYEEHTYLHQHGPSKFAETYGVTLEQLRAKAAEVEAAWQQVKHIYEAEFITT